MNAIEMQRFKQFDIYFLPSCRPVLALFLTFSRPPIVLFSCPCFVMFCPCDVLLLAFGCFRVFFNFCSIEDLGPFETLLFVTTDKAIRVLQLDH